MRTCVFSICVATYKRAGMLEPFIDHLARLDGPPFEVVIVDDGSPDETRQVLASLKARGLVDLRWESIPHAGRAAALNRAFDLARGEFIFLLDDDDRIEPGALADIVATWESIPAAARDGFCGVCGLAAKMDGTVIGDPFPSSPRDDDFFSLRIASRVRGDKREVFRRDALGSWRFPVFAGENRVATNLLWFELAARYRARFINNVWLRKTYLPDGLTANGLRNKVRSANSTALYNATALRLFPRMPWWAKLRFRVDYARYAAHAGAPHQDRMAILGGNLLGLLFIRFGEIARQRDVRQMR